MIKLRTFLLMALIVSPTWVFGADADIAQLTKDISEATTIEDAGTRLTNAKTQLDASDKYKDVKTKQSAQTKITDAITAAKSGTSAGTNSSGNGSGNTNTATTGDNAEKIAAAEKKYEDAKAREQSKANRLLTAASIAATGIGGMELAQGLAEQKADKDAEQDMAAYTATMRCKYGDKSVKAGIEEIELPGGNDETMMKLRTEYFALAADLKERKEALGIKPGIESEVILDKAQMGLYDDENVGITDGAYASLYRANMLNSEKDQQQIDEAEKTSKNRVIGGATAAGVGVVGGIVGDSLINGKLGEKLKQAINDKKIGKETQSLLKKEADALKNLQSCLKRGGVRNTEELNFENFFPSVLTISSSDKCTPVNPNPTVKDLFTDDTDATNIFNKLVNSFGPQTTLKMIGVSQKTSNDAAIAIVSRKIATVQQKFKDAVDKDKETAKQQGFNLENISNISNGNGLRALTSLFNNTNSDEPFSLSTFLNKK